MLGQAKKLLDARQCQPGGGGACFDSFAGFCEIVPGDAMNVGTNDQISMAFPGIELMFLRSADGAGDNLKKIFGSVAVAIMYTDGNSDDYVAAELACGVSGNGRNERVH